MDNNKMNNDYFVKYEEDNIFHNNISRNNIISICNENQESLIIHNNNKNQNEQINNMINNNITRNNNNNQGINTNEVNNNNEKSNLQGKLDEMKSITKINVTKFIESKKKKGMINNKDKYENYDLMINNNFNNNNININNEQINENKNLFNNNFNNLNSYNINNIENNNMINNNMNKDNNNVNNLNYNMKITNDINMNNLNNLNNNNMNNMLNDKNMNHFNNNFMGNNYNNNIDNIFNNNMNNLDNTNNNNINNIIYNNMNNKMNFMINNNMININNLNKNMNMLNLNNNIDNNKINDMNNFNMNNNMKNINFNNMNNNNLNNKNNRNFNNMNMNNIDLPSLNNADNFNKEVNYQLKLNINQNKNQMQFNNSQFKENNNNNIQQIKSSIKAVIYCLGNMEELTQNLLNKENFNDYINYSNIFPITSEYAKIINNSFKDSNNFKKLSVSDLKKIIEKPNLPSFDPKNIFQFIIENIHKEIKIPNENNNNNYVQQNLEERVKIFDLFYQNIFKPEKNTSIISKLFFGAREMMINCANCKKINFNDDIFKFIEFSVEETYKNKINTASELIIKNDNDKNNDKKFLKLIFNKEKKELNLNEFFDYYIIREKQKNDYSCHNCSFLNKISNYNYKFLFLPEILSIILHRVNKVKVNIIISEYLNISQYIESFVQIKYYELIGIISYFEENNSYYGIRKKKSDNQWYIYKNNNELIFNFNNINDICIPYMLFYQAK